ncbi:MAG: hypothetical protein JSW06_09265 [Thermoplasmatales archaeon]|nr:MAG: hypothetical protein JSW06_09265 [Thermoplasmatales archaeon]
MKIKKILLGILVTMLIVISVFSMNAIADPGAKLENKIFGGFPILFGIRYIGGAIVNTGDAIAHNVSFNFTVTGGSNGSIYYTWSEYWGDIPPNGSVGIIIDAIQGFGLVTLTLSASSSNADNVTETKKGFQIRYFTWVPMSWFGLSFLFIYFHKQQ